LQGDGEVFALIEAYAQDPYAMYAIARRLQAEGRTGMSGRAGQRLLRVLNLNPNEGLPKALLSLSYPPAFGAIVQRHAQQAGISPLLMLAFVRQESFFDPRAESPVGALGLTQVLPSTGEALAARLGVSGYDTSKLLHAELNLAFGSSYMATQLRDFGNEIFVAFAAYNAGPGAASRWRSGAGEDADVFLEAIEFRESRLYVQLVAENYAIYRYLYGGEDKPTLP
jgi:soluble lytic murein transglycosylase